MLVRRKELVWRYSWLISLRIHLNNEAGYIGSAWPVLTSIFLIALLLEVLVSQTHLLQSVVF